MNIEVHIDEDDTDLSPESVIDWVLNVQELLEELLQRQQPKFLRAHLLILLEQSKAFTEDVYLH